MAWALRENGHNHTRTTFNVNKSIDTGKTTRHTKGEEWYKKRLTLHPYCKKRPLVSVKRKDDYTIPKKAKFCEPVVQHAETTMDEVDLLLCDYFDDYKTSVSCVPAKFPVIQEIEDGDAKNDSSVPEMSSKQSTTNANGTDDCSGSENSPQQSMICDGMGDPLADLFDSCYALLAVGQECNPNKCDIESKGDAYLPNELTKV